MVRWDWKEDKFLGNASVAMLAPNLILLNYKLGINMVSCLLDIKTFVCETKCGETTKVGCQKGDEALMSATCKR
jgi:hypothetical protein